MPPVRSVPDFGEAGAARRDVRQDQDALFPFGAAEPDLERRRPRRRKLPLVDRGDPGSRRGILPQPFAEAGHVRLVPFHLERDAAPVVQNPAADKQ